MASNKDNFTRFWIIPCKAEVLRKISRFKLEKAFTSAYGLLRKCSTLPSGDYLAEVWNRKQSDAMGQPRQILGANITATPHRSLNQSKAIIICRDAKEETEEELLDHFTPQGVIAVKKFGPHGVLCLTFDMPTYPEKVKVGDYTLVPTKPYIPNPLRCYKCQKFGHASQRCRGQQTCAKCGSIDHASHDCTQPECCVNCKGKHAATSKTCSQYLLEKQVIEIKLRDKILFPEAHKRAKQKSFSQVVAANRSSTVTANSSATQHTPVNRPKMVDCGVQWPLDATISPSDLLERDENIPSTSATTARKYSPLRHARSLSREQVETAIKPVQTPISPPPRRQSPSPRRSPSPPSLRSDRNRSPVSDISEVSQKPKKIKKSAKSSKSK